MSILHGHAAAQALLTTLLEDDRRRDRALPHWHGYAYAGPADFLLQHGRFYYPGPLPVPYRGPPGFCYGNAIMLAVKLGLHYVEGYALAPATAAPIAHAWCTDAAGRLIDVTWENRGLAYMGCVFSIERADDATWNGDACVLVDAIRHYPILRERWTGEAPLTGYVPSPALRAARRFADRLRFDWGRRRSGAPEMTPFFFDPGVQTMDVRECGARGQKGQEATEQRPTEERPTEQRPTEQRPTVAVAVDDVAWALTLKLGREAPLRPELEPRPDRMRKLPVFRGYPVPWFVAWQDRTGAEVPIGCADGMPEFRCMSGERWAAAVAGRLCWVCGEPMHRRYCFLIGPMCGVNRITAEPPCHHDCALWSVRNCPFLSRPNMTRRTNDLPEDRHHAGVMIERNPGVMLLWHTRGFHLVRVGRDAPVGDPGMLISIDRAERVEWWTERRHATRAEVAHAIETGFPALMEVAEAQEAAEPGCGAVAKLAEMRRGNEALWPRG